jgi:hypothetical protein
MHVPNEHCIIISKRNYNFLDLSPLIEQSFLKLTIPTSKLLFCYLITYPTDNCRLGFNNTFEDALQVSRSSRQRAFQELQNVGYLQQINDIDFLFTPNPEFLKIKSNIILAEPNQSKGILKIKRLLQENNISFEEEIIFQDARFKDTGFFARFDLEVSLNDKQYLIEYDGEQHFKKCPVWDKDSESLDKRHSHDLFKNSFCFNHNIPLIRIPFDKKDISIKDLKLDTSSYVLTTDNEKEYYQKRMERY